jgi:hypothetical protein
VQKHREATDVPQWNAMEHNGRTNHPDTPKHRQIQSMVTLLGGVKKLENLTNLPQPA